ncbi:uncharacterized protein KY384_000935 [Bacidia gigantensis]|uniref:uncharacterized protein n=1 Tax=Bacidia gigantensis TaxID=2732470 RepID=UPI001D058531|nr:uncharacterized protein KY384_000935 [Bacidia gigantensis]KAG8534092.1 hypothetical protein KY384_000935 [Bacidia gigantensis]
MLSQRRIRSYKYAFFRQPWMLRVLIALCLLILPFYIVYKAPFSLIRVLQGRWPDVLWHVQTSKPLIALTIDDGPSEYTQEISELLIENGATATFFIIGSQVDGREETLKDLVRNGNELGNHAMHDEPSRSLTDVLLAEQIHTVEDKIQSIYRDVNIGSPPKYFRPGSGFFSTRMRTTIARLGYRLILGSIYPHDPQIRIWRVNAKHILSKLRKGGIIICHDRRSWTVPMLKEVIPEIKRRGYQIVTVTKLLQEA